MAVLAICRETMPPRCKVVIRRLALSFVTPPMQTRFFWCLDLPGKRIPLVPVRRFPRIEDVIPIACAAYKGIAGSTLPRG